MVSGMTNLAPSILKVLINPFLPFVVGLVDHCRWITALLLGHISKVLIKRDYPLTVDGGWVLRRSDLDDLCLNLVAATYIEGATESVASRDSPPGSYQDS